METLRLLGTALGLASLAGINLYLTVFATGLAVQQHWLDVAQTHPQLAILGHPAVVLVSGLLFALQFFADKVPWIDSLWDTVHTVIRPIGGAFLAVRVLGNADPVFEVIAALLAGSVSLMTHSVKAGTRLVANHSPEPFSNIALSLGEDAAVVGGLLLIAHDPLLALAVFSILMLAIAYFGPKLFRAVRANAWLLWRKLTAPAADHLDAELGSALPHDLDIIFAQRNLEGEKIAWAAGCVSASAKGVPGNLFGHLVATFETPHKLRFVARKSWRPFLAELDLATYKAAHEPKFLSENVVLYSLEKKPKFIFLFDRSQRAVVKAIAASLQQRLGTPAVESAEPATV